MYLHNTNEAQILYYVWFKPIAGLHGLEMIFCIKLSILPLLNMKIVSQWKDIPLFLFTLPCFGPLVKYSFHPNTTTMIEWTIGDKAHLGRSPI